MFSNNFFNFTFIVILLCSTGSAIRPKKASIITPAADSTNNQTWSVPFFDNNFGMITTTRVPAPPPSITTPRPLPVISTNPPTPTTIGRTNKNNNTGVSSDHSEPITNTESKINFTDRNSVPAKINEESVASPVLFIIDPNYIINYTSAGITIPSTSTTPNNILPASTTFPPIIIDSSYIFTYAASTSTTTKTTAISSSQSTVKATPTTVSTTITPTDPTSNSTTTPTASTTSVSTTISNSSSASTSPSPLSTFPVSLLTLSSNSTSSYRPLGSDCDYKTTDLSNQITVVNSGGTANSFQVEVPAVIKFDMNITSVPNYIVSVAPATESDVVEIVSASSSRLIEPSSVNIDISDPHLDLGWSASVVPTFPTAPPSQESISQDKCIEYYSTGRRTTRTSRVQVFIINGQASKQKEFPHMAALGYGAKADDQWLCGGSLISENYVVTAGHCLSAKSLGPVRFVRLGTTILQTETLDSADYNVIRRIPYPTYVEDGQYDDIGLLQLDRPAAFTEYIAPICLYPSMVLDGVKLTAIGWGRTTPTGSTARELQKVDLEVISYDVCQKAYNVVPKEELPYGILESSQICAGTADGSNKDTCQGDSGGPLSLVQDGRMYLVGITSFGIGCAQPGVPGVYTRVSHYVSWLEQIVWGK